MTLILAYLISFILIYCTSIPFTDMNRAKAFSADMLPKLCLMHSDGDYLHWRKCTESFPLFFPSKHIHSYLLVSSLIVASTIRKARVMARITRSSFMISSHSAQKHGQISVA